MRVTYVGCLMWMLLFPPAQMEQCQYMMRMSRALCVNVYESMYMIEVAVHKYFCDPQFVGRKLMRLVLKVTFCISALQVWYFTTEPPMTAMPCPSPTPRGCVWRTQRSSQHQASCRPPSLMDMTTVMLAGFLTRPYGEVFTYMQCKLWEWHSDSTQWYKAVSLI